MLRIFRIIEAQKNHSQPFKFENIMKETPEELKDLLKKNNLSFLEDESASENNDAMNPNNNDTDSRRNFILIFLLTLNLGLIFLYFKYLFLSPPIIKIFGLVVLLYFIYLTVDYYRAGKKNT